MPKLRVGVLFGGRSVEHEVSLVSARAVIAALDPAKYDVVPIGISKQGQWLPPGPSQGMLTDGTVSTEGELAMVATDASKTPFAGIDVAFPVTHGTLGEDGSLQGLLTHARIPFVGAEVLGSAVGMDKVMMKRVFRDAGLPVAPFLAVTRTEWEHDHTAICARVAAELDFPCFVKPANGGSSVGISKVHHTGELEQAVSLALRLDRKAVIEQGLTARELECAVLGNDAPQASVVGEIRPAPDHEFYDYHAKYFDDRTQLIIPAEVPAAVADEVRALAVRAFTAVDCSGLARVDFFWRTDTGEICINEINTLPGFTPMSMYPRMWQAAGLSYADLVDRLVELALERHAERQQTEFNFTELQHPVEST